MLKRLFSALLIVELLWCALPTVRAEGTVKISAAAAVLMDAGTGRVLWERDSHTPRLIASTTKLMTALVALESGHGLEEMVTVAPEWAGAEGSSIYLRPGEEVTLETLLYGLLLRSGNDAALAIAGYCGGTVDSFVSQMNQKARELGMKDTGFANPNGLDAEGHRSSAYDMAVLARACLEIETLLWRYAGCLGLKTGYTKEAGRTLVSAARRDGLTLICVTLNAPSDWADHTALLDWGFANYKAHSLSRTGERIGRLPVSGGLAPACPVETAAGLTAALAPGEKPERVWELSEAVLTAPVTQGTQVGEIIYYVNRKELARVPLVTGQDIPDCSAPKGGGWLWRSVFKN